MAGMYPDNQELTIFGEKVQWPGVDSTGKFSNGSFQNPLEKPSFIPAQTINLILDNLSELIKKLGGTPNNTSVDQLAKLFTIAATANTGIMRDASGRAKVAAPKADDDIARKAEVDRGKEDTLKSAKSYADQQTQAEAQERAQGDSATLADAKRYTNDLLIKIFQNGYIQWPGMPTPDTLFTFEGYRWAEVNYDGCFFRAKGKGAHPFGGEEQSDAIRNIKGFLGIEGTFNFSAPFYKETPARQKVDTWQDYTEAYKRDEMGFDASLVVPTAEENRPRNKTFIIWKLEKIEE
jgi:hypothetical protein